jgi:bile acid-coenzyme A ligase
MALLAVGDIAEWCAQRTPDATALSCGSQSVTWAELARLAQRGAAALRSAGVERGDRVALLLPNGIAPFVATLAAWRAGAVPLPISPRTPPVELEAILRVAAPRAIVRESAVDAGSRSDLSYPELVNASATPECTEPPYLKASLSGGSTGRPKVIVSRMAGRVDPGIAPFLMKPYGCQLLAGPIHHSGPYTLALLGLLSGNRLVILPRFDAETALEAIEKHGVDWVFMVPTMLRRLMALPAERRLNADLGSLRVLVHAGAKCPVDLKSALIEWLGAERVNEFYGGTEANGGTWITGQEWLARPGSVGRAAPGYAMTILREDGSPASPGEVGEIHMRPDSGPGSTYFALGGEGRVREDGWESIGDLGWCDDDGYLYIADRRTDLIVRGGANVYPAEVEHALLSHPAVRSAVVVGVADADLGQRVHAFLEAEAPISLAELQAFLQPRLSRYKWPESVSFSVDPLLDEGGKVRRSALRDLANAMTHGGST